MGQIFKWFIISRVVDLLHLQALHIVCHLTIAHFSIFIILIFVSNFMQGIYNYIPETKNISTANNVVAVMYLQFVVHKTLFST